MQLQLWRPLFDLEREIASLFDRAPRFFEEPGLDFRPMIDLIREEDRMIVTVELPGIDPEKDVEISVLEDVLVIKGEKSMEKDVDEEHHFVRERHYGMFERRIPLPDGVAPESVTADYDKGVLTVTIPMPAGAEAPTRSIPITITRH